MAKNITQLKAKFNAIKNDHAKRMNLGLLMKHYQLEIAEDQAVYDEFEIWMNDQNAILDKPLTGLEKFDRL